MAQWQGVWLRRFILARCEGCYQKIEGSIPSSINNILFFCLSLEKLCPVRTYYHLPPSLLSLHQSLLFPSFSFFSLLPLPLPLPQHRSFYHTNSVFMPPPHDRPFPVPLTMPYFIFRLSPPRSSSLPAGFPSTFQLTCRGLAP